VYLSLYQPDTWSYGQDEDGYQLDGQQLALALTDPIHNNAQIEVMHLSPYERLTCCKIKCAAGKTYKLTVSSWATGVENPFWLTVACYGSQLVGVKQEKPDAAVAEYMKNGREPEVRLHRVLEALLRRALLPDAGEADLRYVQGQEPDSKVQSPKNDPKCKKCLKTPPGASISMSIMMSRRPPLSSS
jgi:hypothetical protein